MGPRRNSGSAVWRVLNGSEHVEAGRHLELFTVGFPGSVLQGKGTTSQMGLPDADHRCRAFYGENESSGEMLPQGVYV